jgi:hypothetical protein
VDPSLAGVEVAALTQGVAFLYAQAGELLKRRRDARDRAAEAATQRREGDLPVLELPEEVFAPQAPDRAFPSPAVLDELSESLLDARRNLDPYVLGDEPLEPGSADVLLAVDRLRRLLERIYATRLSFAGERRYDATEHTAVAHVQQGGVSAGGSIKADGGIAGRDQYNLHTR